MANYKVIKLKWFIIWFLWLKCFRQCPSKSGIRKMTIFQCHCYEMNPFWFGQYDFSDLQHLPSWFPCQRVNINRAMVGAVVNQLDGYLSIITRFPSNMLTRGKCYVAEGIYLRRRFCKVACMFAIPLPWFLTLVSYKKKHDACQLTKYLLKYREIMLQDCGRLWMQWVVELLAFGISIMKVFNRGHDCYRLRWFIFKIVHRHS